MKRKIIYIPLDERPCNYEFPQKLVQGSGIQLVVPPMALMGQKKTAGQINKLWEWLEKEGADADGAILAMDTLLYGGIVPSRLHEDTLSKIQARINRLKTWKQGLPNLKLYTFQLIMRCPKYNSNDEEPNYYELWGEDIFKSGYLGHRVQLGYADEAEKQELAVIYDRLPAGVRRDYLERRHINMEANLSFLHVVKEEIVDFHIIPQDDSAPFGLTAIDQQRIRDEIRKQGLELQVYMYPGADEVGSTLLARMVNHFAERTPAIYPRLASVQGPYLTPLYEDRAFYESLKYQILAAGGMLVESVLEADLVLLVNTPGETMLEAAEQLTTTAGMNVSRNIVELVEYGRYASRKYKLPIAVADVAFANGADLQLLDILRRAGYLFDLAGYAGWNTSSNTLGTVIAQSMLFTIFGETEAHRNFLALRFVEDAGYCSKVRKEVTEGLVRELGYTYFSVDGQRGQIAGKVQERLEQFIRDHLSIDEYRITIQDCLLPWNRMFEVGLTIEVVRSEEA
ncbi:DUF4127 family protein [Paenibacillus roseipurpureus]|uniref:DUF4127 family protein n=1 Tax=Paenibacillus roseopurpureus TaxID=2918901 RepID=A0AA96RM63_9BACL|nr:DUF4127 family protein [Paenibacillus sp. MBLB1832]WNR46129.1 DUF4127 family protein [Paenibacillus sp. MBLB1832]